MFSVSTVTRLSVVLNDLVSYLGQSFFEYSASLNYVSSVKTCDIEVMDGLFQSVNKVAQSRLIYQYIVVYNAV